MPTHPSAGAPRQTRLASMGAYANRTHFRDSVTGLWWKVCALLSVVGWVLLGLGDYGWVVLGPLGSLVAWQIGHAGVWAGQDDILIVHPVWGRRRVRWADIERFAVRPFNQWMIAWVITRTGEEIRCQGISSGRKRTQRVDVVVEKLNEVLRTRTAPQESVVPSA